MVSKISSFFEWLLQDETITRKLSGNPCKLVRPKAPKAYQSESTKSLDDQEIKALLNVIKARADQGEIQGMRDYALFLIFISTGMRRQEVISLRWKDIKINGTMIISGRVKGGEIVTREVAAPQVKEALIEYIEASGGRDNPEAPLWLRHDRGAKGEALSSHGWALALKEYGKIAGIDDIHCHMTRHSYARMVSEESGSLNETSEALGHKSISTTRVYVQRVGCKRDKFSTAIFGKLEF
jgi:integrase